MAKKEGREEAITVVLAHGGIEGWVLHRKKKVREFPVPSRDVTIPNSPWAGIMTS